MTHVSGRAATNEHRGPGAMLWWPYPPTIAEGPWIQTYTGRKFHLFDPSPDEVDPVDIAHALSMLCRYTGHVKKFYSVAEHSVRVSWAVPPEDALYGLLHDAAEAYLGDVSTPLKQGLPQYKSAEAGVYDNICAHFGISTWHPASVKEADLVLLNTERRDLLGPPPQEWHISTLREPLAEVIVPWTPDMAERMFAYRLRVLLERRAQ